MKIGIRKPSVTKSLKARTTGNINRKVKGSINPLYGNKGMGYINNPRKAVYNKVYNKSSFSILKWSKNRNIFVNIFFFIFYLYYLLFKYVFYYPIKWIVNKFS